MRKISYHLTKEDFQKAIEEKHKKVWQRYRSFQCANSKCILRDCEPRTTAFWRVRSDDHPPGSFSLFPSSCPSYLSPESCSRRAAGLAETTVRPLTKFPGHKDPLSARTRKVSKFQKLESRFALLNHVLVFLDNNGRVWSKISDSKPAFTVNFIQIVYSV